MAIVVKNKNIIEELVDENGKVLGYISYNPNDTTTYTKLCNIMESILEINNKSKMINNIKNFPTHIENLDEFEKYREDFNKMKSFFDFHDDKIDEIIENVDSIFGKGTCEILMGNSKDIDLITPLIDDVIPKFQKARKDKTNKYIKEENNEQLDVMN